ncbi:MAG: glycosyltransferase family 4 protein [Verrucomicrobiales bacterium]
MIVHLVPHFGLGGDLVIVKAMVKAQLADGEDVRVNGMAVDQAFGEGREMNPFPLNEGKAGFSKAWANRESLPKDIEVLHAHSPICLLFALLIRRVRCRKAAVIFTFHWPVPDGGWRRALKAKLFQAADVVHAYSVEIRDIAAERYGIPDERLELLHVGVPPERFTNQDPAVARESLRQRLGLAEDTNVLGYLGRLADEKNAAYLIRFLESQNERFPDLHLVVAGTGDLEQGLREQAAASAAAERIHFLGYTREPEAVYPAFDLLVLPSDFEAFALVVVEAAYCGVPTLRSDVEGSRDQITEGETGYTYPQAQGYDAMEEALIRILDDKWSQLPEVGRKARAHCLELCDMARYTAGLESMYGQARRLADS